ncbi:MAG: hypothetical protein ACRECA_01560 [Pseudolabrys sp.]
MAMIAVDQSKARRRRRGDDVGFEDNGETAGCRCRTASCAAAARHSSGSAVDHTIRHR